LRRFFRNSRLWAPDAVETDLCRAFALVGSRPTLGRRLGNALSSSQIIARAHEPCSKPRAKACLLCFTTILLDGCGAARLLTALKDQRIPHRASGAIGTGPPGHDCAQRSVWTGAAWSSGRGKPSGPTSAMGLGLAELTDSPKKKKLKFIESGDLPRPTKRHVTCPTSQPCCEHADIEVDMPLDRKPGIATHRGPTRPVAMPSSRRQLPSPSLLYIVGRCRSGIAMRPEPAAGTAANDASEQRGGCEPHHGRHAAHTSHRRVHRTLAPSGPGQRPPSLSRRSPPMQTRRIEPQQTPLQYGTRAKGWQTNPRKITARLSPIIGCALFLCSGHQTTLMRCVANEHLDFAAFPGAADWL